MDAQNQKPFSKKKIVFVAAFFVLLSIAFILAGFYFHQSEDSWDWNYWGLKFVVVGSGCLVVFSIALVQGLIILFSRDK